MTFALEAETLGSGSAATCFSVWEVCCESQPFCLLISFNPVEVSNNIAANGGSVRGIRPGYPTVQYIQKILKRVTLIGAFFLCIVAGLPMLVTVVTTAIESLKLSVNLPDLSILTFGGSSLLIVVGVALETVRDLEAQISLRTSKGFLN